MSFNSKNNFIKKIFCIFFIVLSAIIFLNVVNADVVLPTEYFYVNDYANVLTSETKNYIMNMNIELEKKTGAQIVVVTINSLGGTAIEPYATNLFRKFGIGDKDKNNGLLLLLAVDDRQSRIEVGYGLEGALTDGKTGIIQDKYMIPHYSINDWDSGIKNGFDACLSVIMDEYNIEIDGAENVEIADKIDLAENIEIMLGVIIFVVIIILISRGNGIGFYGGSFHSTSHRSSNGFSGGGGRSGGGR